jgi:hypothetical protein
MQDKGVEGIQVAFLGIVDESLFVHWSYFITAEDCLSIQKVIY